MTIAHQEPLVGAIGMGKQRHGHGHSGQRESLATVLQLLTMECDEIGIGSIGW